MEAMSNALWGPALHSLQQDKPYSRQCVDAMHIRPSPSAGAHGAARFVLVFGVRGKGSVGGTPSNHLDSFYGSFAGEEVQSGESDSPRPLSRMHHALHSKLAPELQRRCMESSRRRLRDADNDER